MGFFGNLFGGEKGGAAGAEGYDENGNKIEQPAGDINLVPEQDGSANSSGSEKWDNSFDAQEEAGLEQVERLTRLNQAEAAGDLVFDPNKEVEASPQPSPEMVAAEQPTEMSTVTEGGVQSVSGTYEAPVDDATLSEVNEQFSKLDIPVGGEEVKIVENPVAGEGGETDGEAGAQPEGDTENQAA